MPASAGGGPRRALVATLERARSVPVTWVVVGFVLAASVFRMSIGPGLVSGHVDELVSTGFDAVVLEHRWWSVLASMFFVVNPFVLAIVVVALILGLGWSERRMGHWRTAVAFVAVAVGGILLGVVSDALGIVAQLPGFDAARSLRTTDPAIALIGVIMAASAFTGPSLRRRIRVSGFAALLVFVLYSGQQSDLFRLLAGVVGLVLGMVLTRRPAGLALPRATRREARTLLAAVVAITAFGPVVTIFSPASHGMLDPLGQLFRDPLRDFSAIAAQCTTGDYSRRCVDALALSRLDGPGSVLLAVLPLVALLVAAWGIARGRRIGLWLAVALNVGLTALAAVYYGLLPIANSTDLAEFQSSTTVHYQVFVIVSILVPFVIAVTLACSIRLFPGGAGTRSALRFAGIVGTLLLGTASLYLLVALSLRSQFQPAASFIDLVMDLPERFIPAGFLSFEPAEVFPTGFAAIAYQWVGAVFWFEVIVAAIIGMSRIRLRAEHDSESRVRDLLVAGTGGTMSWMATWEGNHYWFAPTGDAVAYRVVGGVAITTAEPLAAPERHADIARTFASFCVDNGWIPVFYSVGAPLVEDLARDGWSVLRVAEETVVRPANWSLDGKRMQDIRSSMNRAAKEGVRARWLPYSQLGAQTTRQVREISEAWVAEKGLPEMGFTLGGIDELADRDVMLMIALGDDGTVHGVTSWLPSYREGRVVGWTLDFMRRRPDGVNGIMEFLIAETILQARVDGIEFVGLSAAPLAVSGAATGGRASNAEGILSFLGRSLEPVYGFRSLLKFKMKFQPEFRELYLCYVDPLELPRIGVSLARAYLPTLSARHAIRMLGGPSRPAPTWPSPPSAGSSVSP
jgi:lysylphosphatidylglycerol synthetase-like protein (DUF2156 family)